MTCMAEPTDCFPRCSCRGASALTWWTSPIRLPFPRRSARSSTGTFGWKPRRTRCSTSLISRPRQLSLTRMTPKWWWTTPSRPRYCSIRWRTAPTWSYIPPPNTSVAIPTWSAERWCSTTGKSAMKWRSCRTRPELCHLLSTPGLTFVASKRWICASSSTVVTP